MFEVGKHYKRDDSEVVFKCTAVGENLGLFRRRHSDDCYGSEFSSAFTNMVTYKEHKIPKKFVRYYNIYPDGHALKGICAEYSTRAQADKSASPNRVGCMCFGLVEGVYDD